MISSFFVKLDKTTSISINDVVLIPLKADITKLFGTNKIEFQISIKDNKIILESPEILPVLDFPDNHQLTEIPNVN